jgi:hypothetical protein
MQRQIGRTNGLANAGDRHRKSRPGDVGCGGRDLQHGGGKFKNKIAGLGDGCLLSVPTVITGTEYSLHSMVNDEMHTVLLFEGEPVVLSLEVHS